MVVIIKREKIGDRIKQDQVYKVSHIADKKNYSVARCIKCALLFQKFKERTEIKHCPLCKFESSQLYRAKVIYEHRKKHGKPFSKEVFYSHYIRKHKQLQFRKENLNKALNVNTVNEPLCLRTII